MKREYTNEELVKLIQEGHEEYKEQLWMQVEKFVSMQATKRLRQRSPQHIRDTYFDDLYQSSYFALIEAIRLFDPERGVKFLTYLDIHLRTFFNDALNLRTEKGKKDPLRNAGSLDAPIPGTEDITQQEVIADPSGEDGYERILDGALHKDINEFVLKAIRSLPTEEYQTYFLTMLSCNFSRHLTANILNLDAREARKLYENGVRIIRKFMNDRMKEITEIGIDDYLSIKSYRGGLQRFRDNAFTSSTEDSVLRLLEIEEGYKELYLFEGE